MDPLRRMEAERACERLVARCALAVNAWDLDAFVALFRPDGVWRRPSQPPLVGHNAIRSLMEAQPNRGPFAM